MTWTQGEERDGGATDGGADGDGDSGAADDERERVTDTDGVCAATASKARFIIRKRGMGAAVYPLALPPKLKIRRGHTTRNLSAEHAQLSCAAAK